jgi:small subunit ribosomal protein S6
LRTYEALYIVKPDLQDDEIQTVAKEVESLVTENGGAIVRSEIWGKRKLAYEVKHCTEGVYILMRFEADTEFPKRLEHYFRLSEAVIRSLVVHFDAKTMRLEEEQKLRIEAEVRAGGSRSEGGDRRRDSDDGRRRRHDRDDDDDDDD